MRWRDAIILAATGARRRAGRAVLTVAAVALATALLTALVAIAGTARTRVLNQLSKGGPLAGIRVAAAEPSPDQLGSDNAKPGAARDLDEEAISRIRGLSDVEAVIPVVTTRVFVLTPDPAADPKILQRLRARNGTTTTTTTSPAQKDLQDFYEVVGRPPIGETMVGVPMAQVPNLPITVLAGRLPDAKSSSELAVTQGYLSRLGLKREEAEAVIGTELVVGSTQVTTTSGFSGGRTRWTRVVIVGVVIQEAAPGQLLAPVGAVRANRSWAASGDVVVGNPGVAPSPYAGAVVIARGLDQVGPVRARITRIGFATTAPENLIASVQRYLGVVEIVLTTIGLIAVGVAALGITNALLAAVRERRREIGVLKAIGGRDRDVLRVFLLEAGVLGFVGGVFGSAGGWGMAWTVARVVNRYLAAQGLAGVALPFPAVLLVTATAGATLLAVAAGAVPALRAAHLPAREAVASG